jgi:translation initiation factor IF-3
VRVIDGVSGQQIGVLPTGQAIRMARERGLDLIEISAQADPPVCKIVDYGKYKYEQEKKKKEAAKSQRGSKLKEMKFRIGIDPHDYTIKIAHAEEFLAHGDKVRVQLQFKGRQMAHQELGFQLARRIRDDLQGMGHVDQEPKMAGRNINMQLTPHPERQRVRKYANFKHGKFINPEEEDNVHESDHDSEIAATAQADALQQNGNGNGNGNGASPANGHETPAATPAAAAPAPSETAETSRG